MKTLIVGLQYGDEGKGRVSAEYGKDADWFVRFNGGPNAGHTVYNEGKKFSLHHLPAGAVLGKKVALDSGMVIDGVKLDAELKECGMNLDNLYISENIHLIDESHREKDKDGSSLGTTKSGIAYVYADRALKQGYRIKDVAAKDMVHLYNGLPPIKEGENAIYESAQGLMIDIDYGHYPYVTSSSVFPGCQHKIDKVVGVFKAYTSRVGDGPPNRKQIDLLTVRGDEYGTTTGRPRKCYWNDLNELDYAIGIAQPDELVMTKVDILEGATFKVVGRDGEEISFSSVNPYVKFMKEQYPKLKYVSNSPQGELIRV